MSELPQAREAGRQLDPEERVGLLRDLRTARFGLSSREAEQRLLHYGPNELQRRGGRAWLKIVRIGWSIDLWPAVRVSCPKIGWLGS